MNKKLKTLCLGALLTTSLFGFTGCDLLSSKTNETVVNDQLSLEEARALLELAFYKLSVNKDGILNNLVMNVSYEEDSDNTYVYVDSDNNTYVFETEISSKGVEELYRAVYDTTDKGTMKFYIDGEYDTSNGGFDYKEKYILEKNEEYTNALTYATYMFSGDLESITINSVEALENGNYSIVCLVTNEYKNGTYKAIETIEITKDAKIISGEIDSCDYYADVNGISDADFSNSKVTYKYNEITTAKINEFMTFINNHKNTFINK